MEDLKTLGKYNIDSVLGQGAMGIVYKGFDPHIERVVAIKTIRKDAFDPKELDPLLARFKREAQAAGRLTHPAIVTVYEYGEEGNAAYIAMEFVQGRELKDFLDNNERFSLDTIFSITNQLLGALAYSHNQGVVHRDIKPANILVLDDGTIKIADFGIARIESSNLTQFGDVMGTPSYMSPEQFAGQRVDKRSDIFSAGIILYHLLTGEKPFPGNSLPTIMHRVMNSDPPRVSELNFQVPDTVDSIIFKALAKNPEDRFQSAEEFAAALNNNEPVPPQVTAPESSPSPADIQEDATIQLTGASVHDRNSIQPGPKTIIYRKGRSWTFTFFVLLLLSGAGFLVWKIYADNLTAEDLKRLAIEKYSDVTALMGVEAQKHQIPEITQSSKQRPQVDRGKTTAPTHASGKQSVAPSDPVKLKIQDLNQPQTPQLVSQPGNQELTKPSSIQISATTPATHANQEQEGSATTTTSPPGLETAEKESSPPMTQEEKQSLSTQEDSQPIPHGQATPKTIKTIEALPVTEMQPEVIPATPISTESPNE